MNPNRTAVTAGERLKIAERLGLLQRAERERLARQGQLDGVVGGHLNEHGARRAAFVKLAGRMQETRSITGRRRDVKRIAKVSSNSLNQFLVLSSLLNVIEHGDIVACVCAAQVSGDEALKRALRA